MRANGDPGKTPRKPGLKTGFVALTGSQLVTLRDGSLDAAVRQLEGAGFKCWYAKDCDDRFDYRALPSRQAVMFSHLGVALVNGPVPSFTPQGFPNDSPFVCSEGERRFDGVPPPDEPLRKTSIAAVDDITWGLRETGAAAANSSGLTGVGTTVCVLDSGIDRNHPDFATRNVVTKCFTGEGTVRDRSGHGTHCAGTIWGPPEPEQSPRYGMAWDATLLVGKVIDDTNIVTDGSALAGIDWAIANRCDVVSMSFGARVRRNEPHSTAFEWAAHRALEQGTLLVAAAGNDSARLAGPGGLSPVRHPANCPSIMAIAAINEGMGVVSTSNAGLSPNGGEIDLAAPGELVRSAWIKQVALYKFQRGTSMAAPFVSGAALLHAQANPGVRGSALRTLLLNRAKGLPPLGTIDVGKGLVQAV